MCVVDVRHTAERDTVEGLANMAKQTVLVSKHFRAFIMANAVDRAGLEALSVQRVGSYGHAVRAGIAARGDVEAFSAGADALMDEIRTNANGIALAIGAQIATRATEDGADMYRVPSAVSAAKSVVLSALRLGVPLVEADGRTPVSYSSIRDAVIGPKSVEDASPIEQRRNAVRVELRDLLRKVRSMSDEQLNDLQLLFEGMRDEEALALPAVVPKALPRVVPTPIAAGRRRKA